MKKSKKKWIILIIVLVVIAVGIGGCMLKLSSIKPMIETTKMQTMDLETFLSTSGVIKTGDTQDYIVKEKTYVDTVHVKVGDKVKSGDLLVGFDHKEANEELKRASIAYEKQRLFLNEAERNYFEVKDDIKKKEEKIVFCKEKREQFSSSSHPDDMAQYARYDQLIDTYEREIEALKKSIPSAEKIKIDQLTFEEATMSLKKTQEAVANLPNDMYADTDGVIEVVTAADLRMVDKGQIAVSIRNTETNIVELSVSKYDIAKISIGMPCTVTVGGKDYQGQINEIDTYATTPTSVKTKILVTNADDGFIPGLEADVEIRTYTKAGANVLPIEAVKTDRNGDFCYALELADAEKQLYTNKKQYITIGNTSDFYIEVLDGLSPELLVAKNPPSNIEIIPISGIIETSQPKAE